MASQVKRILLVKLDHIGDFILASATFSLIRKTFPAAEITLVCCPWNKALAMRSGFFDHVVCVGVFAERSEESAAVPDFSPAIPVLQALPLFDIAIDLKLEDETREALSYVCARVKAGYEAATAPADMAIVVPRPAMKPWVDYAREQHVARLMYILASTVIAEFKLAEEQRGAVSKIAQDAAAASLPTGWHGPLIGLNTGSGVSMKQWPIDLYAQLAKILIEDFSATVLIFGSRRETSDAQRLQSLVQSPRLLDLTGQTDLPGFMATVRNLDLFIGNDTGTTHLATGTQIPTICLFSGNAPLGRFRPIGENVSVLYHYMTCAPCGLKKVVDCPEHHACMRGITVAQVRAEVERLLGSDRAGNALPASIGRVRRRYRRRMHIGLIGNCQVQTLEHLVGLMLPEASVLSLDLSTPEAHDEGFRRTLSEQMKDCDLLFTHWNTLSYCQYEELLQGSRGKVIRIANFFFRGLYPDMCMVGDFARRVKNFTANHSVVIIDAFLRGLSVEEAVAAFNPENYERLKLFDAWDSSIGEMRRRDQLVDYPAADLIESRSRQYRTFLTINHPTVRLLYEYFTNVLSACGVGCDEIDLSKIMDPMEIHDVAGVMDLVAERFGLEYRVSENWRINAMGRRYLPLPQLVKEFYRAYEEMPMQALKVHSPSDLVESLRQSQLLRFLTEENMAEQSRNQSCMITDQLGR